ncbi:conserved hypothetical protein [Burkholderia vietnamiensis]|nr:conserved hypothetical protein [Burkholderia vietnamiensis]
MRPVTGTCTTAGAMVLLLRDRLARNREIARARLHRTLLRYPTPEVKTNVAAGNHGRNGAPGHQPCVQCCKHIAFASLASNFRKLVQDQGR